MRHANRRILQQTALIAAVLFAPPGDSAWSQTGRPLKMVVPYTPGGGTDTPEREQIGRTQRVTMVVENRPGAGTVIGTEAASRAAPDGTTVLITDSTEFKRRCNDAQAT
jgi:tripartite-type tricarboxylate transporter receptor subunit TctC